MQNEANLTWSTKMHRFIQEIIHYRNSIEPGSVIDEAKLKEIEQKYTDLLKTARDKYDYEPPTQYYMNGYNLYKRMGKIWQIIFCSYIISRFRQLIMKQNDY